MSSTHALWSSIVATFAEIDELCTEALAAELGVQRRRVEERAVSAFAQGRGAAGAEPSPEAPQERRYTRAVALAKDLAFREAHPDGADVVRMRDGMRKLLDALRKELSRALREHEVYSVLIPIVIYCDELANAVTRGAPRQWEPLQSEKFNIENGGELFYWSVEERLRQQETPPLVFEVFYFCLNDGFVGMHQGDPRKIDEYKDRLRKRIPVHFIDSGPRKERVAPKIARFPWKYYAVAFAVVLAIYALLRWAASSLT